MLIKAYIKNHMFHLPTLNNQILETQVEQALNKKIDKSRISKLYPLTKIEDNENILIEKQRTNIFLLNLLLLVINYNKKNIEVEDYYNDVFIISKLEEETNLKLENIPFDNLEKNVMEYLNLFHTDNSKAESNDKNKDESKNDSAFESVLENVEFSLDWLKKAQKELGRD